MAISEDKFSVQTMFHFDFDFLKIFNQQKIVSRYVIKDRDKRKKISRLKIKIWLRDTLSLSSNFF